MNRPRRRGGCLGCGCLGCLGQLIALFLLGGVFVLLVVAVFTPWAYFLGGKFHLVPGWSGRGTAHTRSGDFTLYVNLEPAGPGRITGPRVSGIAVLIDPAREKHVLRIVGDFPEKWWGIDANGRRMVLTFHRRPGLLNPDARPRFDLTGEWRVRSGRADLARSRRKPGPARDVEGGARTRRAARLLPRALRPRGPLSVLLWSEEWVWPGPCGGRGRTPRAAADRLDARSTRPDAAARFPPGDARVRASAAGGRRRQRSLDDHGPHTEVGV
jgi:hypothetical protein